MADIVRITLPSLNATTNILKDRLDNLIIPTKLSQLSQDNTHRIVTDIEKITWNNKEDSLVFGILNTNSVIIDSSTIVNGEYAKFTNTGLESRSIAELISDLGALTSLTGALLLDQATPQSFSAGTVTESGFLKVASGVLGLDIVTYEPTFSKNTGFNKDFGTVAGTVLEGRTFGTAAASATTDFAPASVYPASGLTTGYVPYFNSYLRNSGLYYDGTNVGIGTTAPDTKLTVNGDISFPATNIIYSNFAHPNTITPYGINGAMYFNTNYGGANGGYIFNISGTPKVVIDGNGNVGIGTTAPGTLLNIQIPVGLSDDILRVGNNVGNYFGFARSNTTGTLSIQGNQIGYNNIVLAPTSGNAAIGYSTGTEINNNKLAVNGSGYFNGTVDATSYKIAGVETFLDWSRTGYAGTAGQILKQPTDASTSPAWWTPNFPTISSGIVAPISTPTKIGDEYIDTSAKKIYKATGITNSLDWTILN